MSNEINFTQEGIKYCDLMEAAISASASLDFKSINAADHSINAAIKECKHGLDILEDYRHIGDGPYFGIEISDIVISSLKQAQTLFIRFGLLSLNAAATELQFKAEHEPVEWVKQF